MSTNSSDMSIKKVVCYQWYKGSFKVCEPIRGELSKDKLNRVNERQLKVTKREGGGMGMTPYFGTKIDRGKRAIGLHPNVVENVSTKEGNEGDGMGLKIGDVRE